ncbi:TrbI/VirB10 family protein [Brevundimonas sp.]|uniref:TrbI/VirB10 family protein n=1 Tax=Brevundimonas sp. TaxID=1871086 RepID=UPI002FCA5BF2
MSGDPKPDTPAASPAAKEPPPELAARAARPRVIRLRRSVAQGVALGAAALLAGALTWAFVVQPELRAAARARAAEIRTDEARGSVRPAEIVTDQPASYDRLAQDRLIEDHLPEARTLGSAPPTPSETAAAPPPRRPAHPARPRAAGPSPDRGLTAEARQSGLFFAAFRAADPAMPTPASARPATAVTQAATYGGHSLTPPLSPFELKAGAVIPAVLLSAVDTARPGPVVASVTQNVFDTVTGRHLLLPQGARLIGRHEGESRYGDRRAFLTWERLILPNGKSLVLTGEPGVDAQGAVGVRGRADRRLLPLAMASLFAGAITTLGEIARDDDDSGGGLLGDAGDAAAIEGARVGGRLIDRELTVAPSIRLRPGAPVRVLITRDLILEPYQP